MVYSMLCAVLVCVVYSVDLYIHTRMPIQPILYILYVIQFCGSRMLRTVLRVYLSLLSFVLRPFFYRTYCGAYTYALSSLLCAIYVPLYCSVCVVHLHIHVNIHIFFFSSLCYVRSSVL
jgi:hypothetical protein